jgi:E3 ubiquitin-protein ligase ZNF598
VGSLDIFWSQLELTLVHVRRHTAFIARINALTSNSTSAVPAVKAAVQSYRTSESGPRDLISTVFNVVNRDLDGTASLMNSIVELLDDEDKRRELLANWNGFKIEVRYGFLNILLAPHE